MEWEKELEKEFEERLTDPDEKESTELGEVPAAERKGSITPSTMRRYGTLPGPY